ncbi:hypothetical protein M8494_25295 [Serratia ureilytica]
MARTQDPTAGRVFYGGRDVRALSARQLAGGRGVMWQDNRLLRGSVRWNLTQGRTDIGDERLLALLAALDLPPDVLEEEVGSDGDRFSGRAEATAVPRTLLQGAPRLLLDEPGASLDLRNAERVAALLAGWPGTAGRRHPRSRVGLSGGSSVGAGRRAADGGGQPGCCARRGAGSPVSPRNDRRSIEKPGNRKSRGGRFVRLITIII